MNLQDQIIRNLAWDRVTGTETVKSYSCHED